jgi:predicted Ser/Thr protein kinase
MAERIQDLRQNIGASSAITGAEELELLELLGEGSFGKVFRGMWRGSVVAIKTMILPARMSGAEKRERMLVMEAAISTALLHPNIVQVGRTAGGGAANAARGVSVARTPRSPSGSPAGCVCWVAHAAAA